MTPGSRRSALDIRPGVGAIVRDDAGWVLLHRRTVGAGWAPISGHIEPGETLHHAVAREIAEADQILLIEAGVSPGRGMQQLHLSGALSTSAMEASTTPIFPGQRASLC